MLLVLVFGWIVFATLGKIVAKIMQRLGMDRMVAKISFSDGCDYGYFDFNGSVCR